MKLLIHSQTSTLHWVWDYLTMLGLNHVSKRGPDTTISFWQRSLLTSRLFNAFNSALYETPWYIYNSRVKIVCPWLFVINYMICTFCYYVTWKFNQGWSIPWMTHMVFTISDFILDVRFYAIIIKPQIGPYFLFSGFWFASNNHW